MTKLFLLFLGFIFFVFNAKSQIYKNVLPESEFSESISKIVLDFRNNFHTIQKDPVPKEIGMDLYESGIKLPGSIDNYISRSHSLKDQSASFQATMYSGDDYEKAERIYKNVFKLIKKTRVRWVDRSLANFVGKMEPATGLNFTVSYLTVEISDERYKDCITEVELVNKNFSNWEVHVNIVRKKPDIAITPDY